MRKAITYLILFILKTGFLLRSQTTDSLAWSDNEDTSRIKIIKLDLNSNEEDFSPIICNNKILFTSSRPTSFGVVHKEPGNKHHTNIYYASKKDSTNFSTPKLWPGNVNTHYNEGCATLNTEEDLMIYTANDPKTLKDNLCLFLCIKINGKWQNSEKMWFCNDNYSYCHPTLKSDGKILFFASDRDGPTNGMDIYYSTYTNDKWGDPQNIGTKINTSSNEIFPMISLDNTLYFSSNRAGGLGGLDLYSLNMTDPTNNEVIHLKSPINSAFDDFGIFSDSLGESGYFSSSRYPKNEDEIYYFKITTPEFKNAMRPTVETKFCYTFFEETAEEGFDSIGNEYEWNLGDGTIIRGSKVKHCYAKHGTYTVQLNIVEKNTGVLFYNEVSYDHIIPEPAQLKIECIDELLSNQKLRFCIGNSSIPGYTIQKVFWDFGDNRYSNEKKIRHIFKTHGTYTITLGVIAKDNTTGQLKKFKKEQTVVIKDNF